MIKIDELSCLVTGRTSDLFLPDLEANNKDLKECLEECRILVVGGAGSIGAATIHALAIYGPQAVHVVDQNENGLAELVRDLRSSMPELPIQDFRTLPIDFGSPTMLRFLEKNPSYDLILNFAALKHVRSEKNVCSLLQLLDTNVIKAARFFSWVAGGELSKRYFCVSTDKAANPVNLMGASKRIMEHLIFSDEVVENSKTVATSARFANVAFSDGSLLASFLKRLEKKQPLAVPHKTRRYFISLRESGQICLLAAVLAPDKHIFIPRLNPENDLIELETVARSILQKNGYEPRIYEEEKEAKLNLERDIEAGRYPLLLTHLDTTGEKAYEEFAGNGESSVELGMSGLLGIKHVPVSQGKLPTFLKKVEKLLENPEMSVTKKELIKWMRVVVPNLKHVETGKNLDQRM